MTSGEKGKPLPKFGEWDVNNPASADGFTVIFAKARDEKKGKTVVGSPAPPNKEPSRSRSSQSYDPNKGLICQYFAEKVALLFLKSQSRIAIEAYKWNRKIGQRGRASLR
ncbi:RPM1-interacting protein 4 family protein [Perilla frutescens var. hirtella]|nr:RPM1-interacting protein 4 family protein [Perilla frutescens var. frutescens]KAH6800987.1 RPM1-interacting protein 4 family protein [Perilla frutescens var. hirtella]